MPTTTAARDVADRFFKAWTSKDFKTARSLLNDDVDFKGPLDSFHRADDYLAAIQQLAAIIKSANIRKELVDGQDVVVIYDMATNTPAGTAQIAEWYRVEGDKIAAIRVFFDPRPIVPPGH